MFFSLNFIIISGYECRISIQNEGVQEMEQNPSLQENTRNKPKKIRKNKNYYKRYTIRFINRRRLYLVFSK